MLKGLQEGFVVHAFLVSELHPRHETSGNPTKG